VTIKRPIVLVCEDDSLVRMVIVDYLTDNGCTVIEAGSGEDAVGFIDGPDQQLDVLFTDIRLGGTLYGWDVAETFPRSLSQPARPICLRLFHRTTAGRCRQRVFQQTVPR
jgi:CheY-like chemotaxis protein